MSYPQSDLLQIPKQRKQDTLLLIEDNALNLLMLTRRLEKREFKVIGRENGRDLLQVIAQTHPELILMDIFLPEIDGLALTRQLKASASTALIPIIAVTALAMNGDREKAFTAGCDDYFSKPIDFASLLLGIQSLLEKSRHQVNQAWKQPDWSADPQRV